MTAHTVSAKL